MYAQDTILELKEPRGGDFPYDRVRVVGPSPVQHGHSSEGQWEGSNGQGVIIEPLSAFGGILEEPLGKLQALYNVVETPEVIIPAPTVRMIDSSSAAAGPTPEEVFAKEAPGAASEDGRPVRHKKTPKSPLDDPRPKADASPLDKKEIKKNVASTSRSEKTRPIAEGLTPEA